MEVIEKYVINEITIAKINNMNYAVAYRLLDDFWKLLKSIVLEKSLAERIIIDVKAYRALRQSDVIRVWMQKDIDHKRSFNSFMQAKLEISSLQLDGEFCIQLYENEIGLIGGTYAIENNGAIVSIPISREWEKNVISGLYKHMDCSGNILTVPKELFSIYNVHHLDDILKTKQEQEYSEINTGYDLWDNREKMFPDIVFCESVKSQMHKFTNKDDVRQILNVFIKLQSVACGTEKTIRDVFPDFRDESDSVKNNKKLKQMRLFRVSNNKLEYIFTHISFSGLYGSRGRIYLRQESGGKILVAYVGDHLKTKKY